MKRSNTYITTLDHYVKSHGDIYNDLRLIVSLFNKVENTNFRMMRRGRLGRNNAAASLYRGRYHYHVRTDHAARFDIYLYDRTWVRDDVSKKQKLNAMLKSWASKSLASL